jgi:hypothetical protein
MTAITLVRPARGRPRKFGRPSRAVTLTLPDDVIAALRSMDEDVSRSVVRLVQPLAVSTAARPAAEQERHGDSAVIVFRPVKALSSIPGVTLVPLPDGRALESLDDSLGVHEFELRLLDVLADDTLNEMARAVLTSIAQILKTARRSKGVEVHQRKVIVLQSARRAAKKGAAGKSVRSRR